MRKGSNAALFWPVIVLVAVLDVVTKAMAVQALAPQRIPHEVLGEYVRLTLVYNPGAAFGLHLGPQSRWIFTALTLVALVILWRLYRATQRGDTPRVLALALVCAGAVGNLIDRLRSGLGVVDFLDVGVGATRWPTFNVADMAVSVGAILLAWVLWQEDRAISAATEQSSQASTAATGAPFAGAVPADRGEPV
jgi:signal peptidase II